MGQMGLVRCVDCGAVEPRLRGCVAVWTRERQHGRRFRFLYACFHPNPALPCPALPCAALLRASHPRVSLPRAPQNETGRQPRTCAPSSPARSMPLGTWKATCGRRRSAPVVPSAATTSMDSATEAADAAAASSAARCCSLARAVLSCAGRRREAPRYRRCQRSCSSESTIPTSMSLPGAVYRCTALSAGQQPPWPRSRPKPMASSPLPACVPCF